ncbi:MAG: hypothetical protein IPL63_04060 [Saprospiraceae bacterium]|nr:hypothetical protein [Saprospiraceae bacterium]
MNFNFIKLIIILVFLHIAEILFAQGKNVRNYYITNFTKSQYIGGIENWDIATSKDGYIYIANNEGLLKYDGYNWTKYKLPNKTIVRSVALDTVSGRIYVGGQDEVGFFYGNKNGILIYKSIKDLLPPSYTSLEDVWDIHVSGKNVFFRSLETIFQYNREKINVISTKSEKINFLKVIGENIYFGEPNKGLYISSYGNVRFVVGSEIFINHRVSDLIEFDAEKILVITERKGTFLYDGKKLTPFTKSSDIHSSILTSVARLDNNTFIVGSVLNGIYFVNDKGSLLYNMSKKNGLQTNSIINLGIDYNGNIWTGTTNGIDQILVNSPYSLLHADGELQGGAYAVQVYKNKLYIGTNNGLYYCNWRPDLYNYIIPEFSKVKNSDGQVWALDIVGGELFMGHNEGAFAIKNDEAIRLQNEYSGTWRFIALPDKNKMITGTYKGLHLFSKKDDKWQFETKVNGFNESARVITEDSAGNIWVSHPYRGVYKLTLDKTYSKVIKLTNYGKSQGLPSDLSNYVTKIKSDIYVNGETGIYMYNPQKSRFEIDSKLTTLMGEKNNVRRLFQDKGGNIWYVNENDCGVLVVEDSPVSKNVSKKSTPFLKGKLIGGFENIYTDDLNSVFACTDKGVIIINNEKLKKNEELKLRLLEIKYGSNDSILYGGHSNGTGPEITIPYKNNKLYISFGTNQLDKTNEIQYSVQLSGVSNEWSEWSGLNFREYNNLKHGKYELLVKARASYGKESEIISVNFRIQAPWYASTLAIMGYFLLFIISLISLIKYLDKKHESEKTVLKMEKEESEAKVEILEREKLLSEIHFKNRELALSTMHIVQKNETLAKLREELNHIIKQSKEIETKSNLKKVTGILSDDQRLEDDWDSFALHFDQVHTDFLKRLKSVYPQLSPKDLKLCAYLRMNLTTKDIAPLMNISVRGVEISRYRLRKKMGIQGDDNLNDFMISF